MSHSKLHNKFMRKQWKGRSLFTAKADHPVRNEHRQDECPRNNPRSSSLPDAVLARWLGCKNQPLSVDTKFRKVDIAR